MLTVRELILGEVPITLESDDYLVPEGRFLALPHAVHLVEGPVLARPLVGRRNDPRGRATELGPWPRSCLARYMRPGVQENHTMKKTGSALFVGVLLGAPEHDRGSAVLCRPCLRCLPLASNRGDLRHLKSIIGDRLRARHPKAQRVEAVLACNALNRMFELGRPVSKAIRT